VQRYAALGSGQLLHQFETDAWQQYALSGQVEQLPQQSMYWT
jgi:hypothetical protein